MSSSASANSALERALHSKWLANVQTYENGLMHQLLDATKFVVHCIRRYITTNASVCVHSVYSITVYKSL